MTIGISRKARSAVIIKEAPKSNQMYLISVEHEQVDVTLKNLVQCNKSHNVKKL